MESDGPTNVIVAPVIRTPYITGAPLNERNAIHRSGIQAIVIRMPAVRLAAVRDLRDANPI